jgi:hypothetical protein
MKPTRDEAIKLLRKEALLEQDLNFTQALRMGADALDQQVGIIKELERINERIKDDVQAAQQRLVFAMRMLGAHTKEASDFFSNIDRKPWWCPRCGSWNVDGIQIGKGAVICRQCTYTWMPDPDTEPRVAKEKAE